MRISDWSSDVCSSDLLLLDGRHGMRALEAAADHPYWIGRPIEMHGSRPLDFESSPDVATELATWPRHHVVKCLAFYHPDDPDALRERQDRKSGAAGTSGAVRVKLGGRRIPKNKTKKE